MKYVVLTFQDKTKTLRIPIEESEPYYRQLQNPVIGFQLYEEPDDKQADA